jgi:hypothetical protein
MILAPLFGTALAIAVAAGPLDDPSGAKAPAGSSSMSPQQKSAMTRPLVRSATDCIVNAVVTDPKYTVTAPAGLGDLIVASMPSCVAPVRAMIDAYDQYYGDGSGESFFMGPYLDVLPQAVIDASRKASR